MFTTALYPKTKQVWNLISNGDFLKSFYLAGGTALALQLGHRKSIDLDFFTNGNFNADILISDINKFNPQIIQRSEGTLDLIIDDVKVSFLEYKYSILESLTNYERINIASIIDISCMKLSAISSRGSKKDFVDLYFILKKFEFKFILDKFKEKYTGINYSLAHILKSITYFQDADLDPDPDYFIVTDWEEVKNSLLSKIKDFPQLII